MIITSADIEQAKFRNQDHDCTLNREVITVAQGYAESENPLVNSATTVFLGEYNPAAKPVTLQAYYPPHFPGKPEKGFTHTVPFEELCMGWFNQKPIE